MKLATRDNGTRDGELIVVSRDNTTGVAATGIAPTMQALMDDWASLSPQAEAVYALLNDGKQDGAFPIDETTLRSPLPRAYAWIDGSAYINHIVLVRKARGAKPPATLETDPLVYQGGSDTFLDPRGDIPVRDLAWGVDFEAEIAVMTDDTPEGVSAEAALGHIKLLMLVNDVSLRNLIPAELGKSFGFFQSKPSSAFSPFAITPDELGDAWQDGRIHRPLVSHLNGDKYGDPDAGPEMHFSFGELIAHIAKTRSLGAGTIMGSGTVSNKDRSRGSACLAEKRMIEKIDTGEFVTPFMQYGDTIRIEMHDAQGNNLFGTIEQTVVKK
ncbi:MAG: fumarylacetoacetate (FAA) hydrolase [Bradymonadia bacterium]|jgi:fumarylacetoacetate (FAA) hydrolase